MTESNRRAVLLGTNRARVRRWLAFSVALGIIAAAVILISGSAVGSPGVWSVGALVLVGAAAVSAYRNTGLLVSWAVVGVATTVQLVLFFFEGFDASGSALSDVVVGLFWAAVITPILGTIGYALGRGLRVFTTDEGTWLDTLLFGHDREEANLWLVVAGSVLLVVLVGLAVVYLTIPAKRRVPGGTGLGVVVGIPLVLAVLAAVQSYRIGGLFVSWALVFAFAFAFYAYTVAVPPVPLVEAVSSILTAGAWALGSAVFGGTVGFLVGTGTRRLVRWRPPPFRRLGNASE